jgi:hypothetical protein
MGIAASKASVALFLLRIVLRRWHIALLWGIIVSTTAFCTITTILLFLQCKPVSFLWNPTIPGGHCPINFTDVALTMACMFSPTLVKHPANASKPGQHPWTLSSPSCPGLSSWAST